MNEPATLPSSTLRRFRPLLIGGGIVGLAGVLALAWWLGFLTPEPDPVSITEAAATVSTESNNDDSASVSVEPETVEEAPAEANGSATLSIDGDWEVVSSDATFIGYRADSQVGEAVGRSPGVTGTLTATQTEITEVSIVGDMTLLTSDSSVRDEHLGNEGLETDVFPTSTFVLTEPIAIGEIPAAGVEQTFTAVGELTVKDITQPVTIELQALVIEDRFVVAGDSAISLVDFGATIGSTTEAVMEFSLVFAQ